jgi:hypothetical protein
MNVHVLCGVARLRNEITFGKMEIGYSVFLPRRGFNALFVARQKGHSLRPRDGGNHTKETRKCRDIGNNSSCRSEDLITQ